MACCLASINLMQYCIIIMYHSRFLPEFTVCFQTVCLSSFSVVAVMLQMIPEAAAEPLPALTCNVTPLTDGSVLYKLSRPANTSQCKERYWQDRNVSPTHSVSHKWDFFKNTNPEFSMFFYVMSGDH